MAEKLCRFVSFYVTRKNFSVGFASASEVARKREGDCTEHGILLAALGRAMGIPSRVVSGLVYVDEFKGVEKAMVYHMWTQFFLEEDESFDPALGKVRCGRRITLFDSLQGQSLTESMLPMRETDRRKDHSCPTPSKGLLQHLSAHRIPNKSACF